MSRRDGERWNEGGEVCVKEKCTAVFLLLTFQLTHPLPPSYLGRANLTEVYLVGVGDALSSHSAAEPKGIKAHFRMDDSGLLLLDNVWWTALFVAHAMSCYAWLFAICGL